MSTPRTHLARHLDVLAAQALHMGLLVAIVEAGEIWHISGRRAETLDKRTGYGRVTVHTTPLGRRHQAMAHRVIWIAAHGVPAWNVLITHINGRGWDNRIDNLTARTESGDVRPGRLTPYTPQTPPVATPKTTTHHPTTTQGAGDHVTHAQSRRPPLPPQPQTRPRRL